MLRELTKLSSKRYVSPYDIAMVYAGLGEKNEALEWLRKICGARSPWALNLTVDPRLDCLRGDERFRELARRLGYDE